MAHMHTRTHKTLSLSLLSHHKIVQTAIDYYKLLQPHLYPIPREMVADIHCPKYASHPGTLSTGTNVTHHQHTLSVSHDKWNNSDAKNTTEQVQEYIRSQSLYQSRPQTTTWEWGWVRTTNKRHPYSRCDVSIIVLAYLAMTAFDGTQSRL